MKNHISEPTLKKTENNKIPKLQIRVLISFVFKYNNRVNKLKKLNNKKYALALKIPPKSAIKPMSTGSAMTLKALIPLSNLETTGICINKKIPVTRTKIKNNKRK